MASSKSVVIAALIANGAIAIMKFAGFLITGSPSMLSETYHSVSDTGNQVFLLIGIWYGASGPTEKHPFGRGKAQFFFAFLVSVLLFGIAGWESAKHGYHAIVEAGSHGSVTVEMTTLFGTTFPSHWVNYAVLTGAIIFESWAMYKAYQGMRAEQRENDWDSLVETFRKTSDVTTLTAFTEDGIALSGAAIALVGVFLTQYTGNPIFDAVTALIIGLLLMGFALALAWENKRLLLGESAQPEAEQEIRTFVMNANGVRGITNLRTVYFGPGRLLVTIDVEFEDSADIAQRSDSLRKAIKEQFGDVMHVYVDPANVDAQPTPSKQDETDENEDAA